MNISSICIQCHPDNLDSVVKDLEESGLCEVHFKDKIGKIVVVIEGENIDEETQKLKQIQERENISSADVIYTYNEEEIFDAKSALQNLEKAIPDVLETDVHAENINYQGHIKDIR